MTIKSPVRCFDVLVRGFSACLLLFVVGCTTVEKTSLEREQNVVVLLNPEAELDEEWENKRLRRGNTDYDFVKTSLGKTVQATGNESASIFYRMFEPVDLNCDQLRWSWYVSTPQPSSDLYTKGRDDVAASVFVMFGDPGIFRDKPVSSLKYVWANDRHQPGEIIAGPYHRKFIRTIIIRTGSPDSMKMFTEQTNLIEDYTRAFGEAPKEGIHGVAIFTDNDDTLEPIVAHYGRVELLCDFR